MTDATQVDERCLGCRSTMAAIDFVIDGASFTMRSCTECDRRLWTRGGSSVGLEDVLDDLVVSRTRYRRDLATR